MYCLLRFLKVLLRGRWIRPRLAHVLTKFQTSANNMMKIYVYWLHSMQKWISMWWRFTKISSWIYYKIRPQILKTAVMKDLFLANMFLFIYIHANSRTLCDVILRTILGNSQIWIKTAKNAKTGGRQSKIWSPQIATFKLVF